jgi:hypothetical protein
MTEVNPRTLMRVNAHIARRPGATAVERQKPCSAAAGIYPLGIAVT